MVDSVENIISKLTYSDSRVGEAFEKYKKEIGNVFERAKNLMKTDRFFPVLYDSKNDTLYIVYSRPDVLWEIKNFHSDFLKYPLQYVQVSDSVLNSYVIHYLTADNPSNVNISNESIPDFQKPEIIRMKDSILEDAILRKASDIHIEIHGGKGIVFLRINGILRPNLEQSRDTIISLIRAFANDAKLDTVDLIKPQNGSIQYPYRGSIYSVRLNIIGTFSGGYNENPTAVLRILYQSAARKMESLGFEPSQLELFKKMADREGIIIVTGPTGSGKTTTLYALLDWFSTEGKKVISIEDPPEIIKENIVQIGVQPARNITWETALENMMRMDPDIILIGEIRDHFAAEAAMQAAITGHTVLTTIHTQGVETIVERFKQLAGESSDVVNSHTIAYHLIGMISQRLVTKIAVPRATTYDELIQQNPDLIKRLANFGIGIKKNGIKTETAPNIKYWLEDPLKLPDTSVTTDRVYKGYDMTESGRTAIAEVVYNDAELSEVIKKEEPTIIRDYLNKLPNHLSIIDHAILKVQRGEISIEDVLRRI